jgi:hypothetical protein
LRTQSARDGTPRWPGSILQVLEMSYVKTVLMALVHTLGILLIVVVWAWAFLVLVSGLLFVLVWVYKYWIGVVVAIGFYLICVMIVIIQRVKSKKSIF